MPKTELAPILLILTNICNQNCPFCFAAQEMFHPKQKEMTIPQLKLILKKCQQANIRYAFFLGGEPTLHSNFNQMLDLSMKQFFFITIFTNGIFPQSVISATEKYGRRIKYIVNLSTPGFISQDKIKKKVLDNIKKILEFHSVKISITSTFLNPNKEIKILKMIPESLIKKISVRFGFATPTANSTNFMLLEDFPKTGKGLIKIIKFLIKYGPPQKMNTAGSWPPCIFDDKQLQFMKKNKLKIRNRCHDDSELYAISIENKLVSYDCYCTSSLTKIDFDKTSNILDIKKYYYNQRKQFEKEYVLPKCKKCRYFGFIKNKCSGPCFGFRINALNNDKK